MEFLKLKINVKEADGEYFTALIIGTGIDSFETTPDAVIIHLPLDGQGKDTLFAAEEILIRERLPFEVGFAAEQDWENNWKRYFKPFNVGKKLLIKPSWEEVTDKDAKDRIILEIDPASAFGTGQHDTTRLCLEFIEEYSEKGGKMLDIGCGSGILSAAASLLGAGSISAADISENALRIASETYRLNGITDYRLFFGDITADENIRREIGTDYGIVAVNIVADVIVAMSGYFSEFLAKSGKLILSGIIKSDMQRVTETLKKLGCKIIKTAESGGWGAIVSELA